MADTCGPTNRLPGQRCTLPNRQMCDEHPEVFAKYRIMMEVDSFGGEVTDMCQMCYDNYLQYILVEDTSGICEWCNRYVKELNHHRDFNEGSGGRVYMVCKQCIQQENDCLENELEH